MGLREIAEADLAITVEDRDGGFGWDVVLLNPTEADNAAGSPLVGLTVNTMLLGDPDTGVAVKGRRVSVAVRISSLPDPNTLPEGIPDTDSLPWRFRFSNLRSTERIWRVADTDPDETLGVLVCHLEPWGVS